MAEPRLQLLREQAVQEQSAGSLAPTVMKVQHKAGHPVLGLPCYGSDALSLAQPPGAWLSS
ncbi:hypothetical protein EES45_16605 [Streptomyces sp. ADI97-07]|nr:hypothetical protein EES45_16605 [Streptomyces sp. ADI97-07]